jgi:membrane peptidoglycan carboxypeptidase
MISLAVEQKYTKDEILEMYLNEVSYGGTAYGVQEAARQYFDKDAKDLTLPEAALLAGLPKSPTFLSPFGSNPEAVYTRQRQVLTLMRQAGFISQSQLDRALDEKLSLSLDKTDIRAPHFVMYIKEVLAARYGEEFIRRSGLEVTTTLDLPIQELAQKAVYTEISELAKLNVTNGAALVVNPQTGEILAMVGSHDYFNEAEDGNVNVTIRPRPPGSSIKIVNYAFALSNGMSPATIIDDSPITFKVEGQPPYTPRNYDGKFRGKLSLRSALAESRNVPAVRVLAQTGITNMIETGRKMGITSWQDPSYYGLSLTLGGGEVTLYELATVYATLANYGKRPELYTINKITDSKGELIYEHEPKSLQAIDPRVAFILTDILQDNDARAPAFGRHSALVIPGHREVAVKTGTSNDLRDNLTIGYNQDYLVAVWVGNNDNSPMSRVASGVTGASPIWNSIMTTLLTDASNHPWGVPEGLIRKNACGREDWFLVENSSVTCPQFQSD